MRILGTVSLLVTLALPLGTDALGQDGGRDRRPRCGAISVVPVRSEGTDDRSRRRRPSRESFATHEVDAVEFRVPLPSHLAGSHRVELKLYTPHGDLYQTLTAILPSSREDGPAAENGRRSRRRRYLTVSLRLPVADTTMVRSSLYGRWRAEAHLDGQPQTCTRPLRFEMRP